MSCIWLQTSFQQHLILLNQFLSTLCISFFILLQNKGRSFQLILTVCYYVVMLKYWPYPKIRVSTVAACKHV